MTSTGYILSYQSRDNMRGTLGYLGENDRQRTPLENKVDENLSLQRKLDINRGLDSTTTGEQPVSVLRSRVLTRSGGVVRGWSAFGLTKEQRESFWSNLTKNIYGYATPNVVVWCTILCCLVDTTELKKLGHLCRYNSAFSQFPHLDNKWNVLTRVRPLLYYDFWRDTRTLLLQSADFTVDFLATSVISAEIDTCTPGAWKMSETFCHDPTSIGVNDMNM